MIASPTDAPRASAQTPSSQRPIPLRGRRDLVTVRMEFKGEAGFVVKDPVALKYHRLRPEQYDLLTTLDGEVTLEQARDRLRRAFPTLALRLQDVQSLVTDLHKKGLVHGRRPGQARGLAQRHREEKSKKFWAALRNILFFRLPGVDPEGLLAAALPLVRPLFRPWAVFLTCAFVVAGWMALLVQFDRFTRELPGYDQFFGFPNLLYIWVLIGAAKIVHELGHGFSCKYFGGECHEIGVMLLVFSPCMYCDVSDSWLLKNKWQRIAIGAAGMYVEVVLSAVAVFVWTFSGDPFVRGLAVNLFFVTAFSTVIFNANPLLRFDGYYILSDFLEIPNLRQKADRLLNDTFGHWCLGIKPKPDPFLPEKGRAWFVLYAVCAAAYRWLVLFGITLFLYTVLKPYGLQSLGAAMAALSVGGIVFTVGKNVVQKVNAPRKERLSRPRMLVSLGLLAAVLAGVLAIPLPLHTEAPFLTEPADGATVYVVEPGILAEVHVAAGQRVAAGDPIATLENDDLTDERARLNDLLTVQEARAAAAFAASDPVGEELANKQADTLRARRDELEKRLTDLELTAPIAGVVVPPPARPEQPGAGRGGRLAQWTGLPLDPENARATLRTGAAVAVVAPLPEGEAVAGGAGAGADAALTVPQQATLFVDQADRNDIYPRQAVELKFDHRPGETYDSRVERFAPRDQDRVPGQMSNKYGGTLATMTGPDGQEELVGLVYQATAPIPAEAGPLRPGMRGVARFDQPDRTAGQWLWRRARRLFLFEI